MRFTFRVRWPAVLVLLAVSTLPPASALAQWRMPRAAIAGGTRVRVTYPGIHRRVGTVVDISRDTLVARWESGATSRLARHRISHLDVSYGRFADWRGGASAGFAIGAAVGAVAGAACAKTSNNCGSSSSDGEMFLGSAIGGGVLGMTVGAIYGTLRPTDDWHNVNGDPPESGGGWRIGLVAPTRRSGLGVAASRAF
ncbi:MAG: hypothetical protein DMD35_22130 [Gemmatimonadetes bacterium]|nr:MAG: hypothetical protein DMD35_22130 [Gemmatimonadota bacterium]